MTRSAPFRGADVVRATLGTAITARKPMSGLKKNDRKKKPTPLRPFCDAA